jgi:hypothetical protein
MRMMYEFENFDSKMFLMNEKYLNLVTSSYLRTKNKHKINEKLFEIELRNNMKQLIYYSLKRMTK